MPTKKPRIQALIEQKNYNKFKMLCEKEKRTESNFAGYIITKYIEEYEKVNGIIETES